MYNLHIYIIMNIQHYPPKEFLEREIRDGYEVSEQMKRVWAIEIDMLQELFRVCDKYGLTIWTEGGTMLGTIRHGGFIPWDDDIDMAMPREDYDRLQEVAADEFKHPYFFQTMHTDPCYGHRHAQLRNSDTAAYKHGQKTCDCNSGIFVDIFPLDYMPKSPRAFKNHYVRISRMKGRMKLVRKVLMSVSKNLFLFCREHVPALSEKVLFRRFEDILRSVKRDEAIAWVDITFNHKSPQRPLLCYKSTEWRCFEYIKMPVPNGYDDILTIMYGDYMTPVQAPTCHGALEYDTERSYAEVLKRV